MKINQNKHDWEIDFFDGESNSAERYGGKKRSELKDSDFMDPKRRSFPVMSCQDVSDAVSAWGRYKGSMTFEEFKVKLTQRAKSLDCEASLPEKWKEESKSAGIKQDIALAVREELADITLYLIRLASVLRVDLIEAVTHKLQKNASKYPVEKAFGSHNKYNKLLVE